MLCTTYNVLDCSISLTAVPKIQQKQLKFNIKMESLNTNGMTCDKNNISVNNERSMIVIMRINKQTSKHESPSASLKWNGNEVL